MDAAAKMCNISAWIEIDIQDKLLTRVSLRLNSNNLLKKAKSTLSHAVELNPLTVFNKRKYKYLNRSYIKFHRFPLLSIQHQICPKFFQHYSSHIL